MTLRKTKNKAKRSNNNNKISKTCIQKNLKHTWVGEMEEVFYNGNKINIQSKKPFGPLTVQSIVGWILEKPSLVNCGSFHHSKDPPNNALSRKSLDVVKKVFEMETSWHSREDSGP